MSTPVFSQSNFEPGRIFLHSGDTVTGELDNRDWKKNPQVIVFRGEGERTINYHPIDISGFQITGSDEWFKSAIIDVDKTSLKIKDVMANINRRGISTDTVFLAVVVKGRLSLYKLTDEYEGLHFFIQKSDQMEELKIQKRRLSGSEVITADIYLSQLAVATSDCAAGAIPSQNAKYSQMSLSKVVLAYNNCFSDKPTKTQKTERMKSFVFAIAGINYSSLTVSGYGYGGVNQKRFKPDVTPTFGIAYEAVLPRNRASWSIHGDLIYRNYSMEEIFEATQLKLAVSFRYKIPVHTAVRPMFGLGFTNAIALTSNSPGLYFGPTVLDRQEFRSHEQGYFVDVGGQGKRIGGWIRYERTNGFSKFSNTGTPFNLWYLTISWRLNK